MIISKRDHLSESRIFASLLVRSIQVFYTMPATKHINSDEIKLERFSLNGKHRIWQKPNTAYQDKEAVEGWWFRLVWNWTWTSCSHCLDHELLCIPESDVRLHVYQLKIVQNRVLQQVNDPKHSNKTTTEWMGKKRLERAGSPNELKQHSPTSCERLWETDKVAQKIPYFKFLTIGSTSGCGMILGFKLQTVITAPPLPVS